MKRRLSILLILFGVVMTLVPNGWEIQSAHAQPITVTATPPSGAIYLQNWATAKCLTVNSTAEGTHTFPYGCAVWANRASFPGQVFHFYEAATVGYRLQSTYSFLCTTSGPNDFIDQWRCSLSDQLDTIYLGNYGWQIRRKYTNVCYGMSLQWGTVSQLPCNSTDSRMIWGFKYFDVNGVWRAWP